VVASAMIDRIVHHAEVITLKGNSYRLKNTKTTLPNEKQENKAE
jgi:DNA replication protein DnaC